MKYMENYRIEYSDCDENQNLKLPAMVDLMMQVSEHQLEQGHASTQDMIDRGLGWVVTQYHFEITALPKPGEQVILSTEAAGYNRFFEYRDFGISTSEGRPLVRVHSQWVMFDLKKRKLIPCDTNLMHEFNVPLLEKMPRFPRLRLQDNYDEERRYRVRYDDLDTNHHLTNSHYFNWFIDMLDRDFLKTHIVKTIDIKFDKEVRYGEMPYSCLTLKENDDGIKSYHAIKNEEKIEQSICEITWRKL